MLHDPPETTKTMMGQILPIPKILRRGMSHQNIKTATDADLPF